MNNTLQEIAKKKYPATNSERPITLTERALSEIRKQEFISGMEQSVGGLIENLKKIEQMSDPGSPERAIVEMKRLATEALSSFKEGNDGWINVEKQLPEIGNDEQHPFASEMILLSDGEFVYSGQYEKSDEMGESFIDENGDDFSDDGVEITHWQPLPSPPKIKP